MYGRLQKVVDRLNNVVQEGLTAIRAVKAFVRGEYEEEKFRDVNQDLMDSSQTTFHYAVLNLPAFQFVMYAAIVLIMWFGGNMILHSTLPGGRSHRVPELCDAGYELFDDDCQCVSAAYALLGQRAPYQRSVG